MTIKYLGVKDGGITTQNGVTRAVRILRYSFDDYERSHLIFTRSEIPRSGDAHPYLTALALSEIGIEGNDGIQRGTYDVSCTYTSDGLSGSYSSGIQSIDTAPWDLPATNVSYDPVDSIVPLVKAYNPKKDSILNPSVEVLSSSGTPILLQTLKTNTLIRFTYNLRTFNPGWHQIYYNTVNKNSTSLLGRNYPSETLTIKKLSAAPHVSYDDKGDLKWSYFQVNAELEYDPKGFTQSPADRSTYFLKDGKPTPIHVVTYESGNKIVTEYNDYATLKSKGTPSPVSEPMNLDGKGNIVLPDSNGVIKTTYLGPYYEKLPFTWGALSFPMNAEAQRHVAR